MLDLTALKAVTFFALVVAPVQTSFLGQFVFEHRITLNGYVGRTDCEADEGVWENGACSFPVADHIYFFNDSVHGLVAEVGTVGNNGNECALSGTTEIVDARTVNVTGYYDADESNGQVTMAVCELTVRALESSFDRISVEVKTPRACEFFCGANVSLAIPAALRLTNSRR